jgi:hypothetical protein
VSPSPSVSVSSGLLPRLFTSRPSGRPSASLSALAGSVPSCDSSLSVRPSPSLSVGATGAVAERDDALGDHLGWPVAGDGGSAAASTVWCVNEAKATTATAMGASWRRDGR